MLLQCISAQVRHMHGQKSHLNNRVSHDIKLTLKNTRFKGV